MTEYTKAIEVLSDLLYESSKLVRVYERLHDKGTKYERTKYAQKLDGMDSVRFMITRALQDMKAEEAEAIEEEYEAYLRERGE